MECVIYDKMGKIAYITLNRPEALNAENNEMKRELANVWVDFRDDPDVWVGIVTGAGDRAFSAGSDVKEFAAFHAKGIPIEVADEPLNVGKIEIYKPIIAAVNGWCVGGGLELVLACDIRIATENARFGLMEPKVGRFAAGGGAIRLPNQIPFAVAMEMILTGDPIDAERAYEIGLINRVVPSLEDLIPAAEKMANRILSCAPLAVSVSKEQAIRGFNMPNALGLPLRELRLVEIRNSQDTIEGALSFSEKKKPVWKGV